MRSPAILSLLLLCGLATQAEARLFLQTYGSTVPTAEGCAWNANSDYFVPRHCDTGRYGLFSACKTSCTTSPACYRRHALYPGYCSPYGGLHYCWRNHVYAHKCGCCPVAYNGPYRPGCGPPWILSKYGCHGGMCANGMCSNGMCGNGMCSSGAMYGGEGCIECDDCAYLPNIESDEFQILGSISLTGDPLLTSLQLGGTPGGMPLLPGQVLPGQLLSGQALPGQMPAGQLMPNQVMPAVPQVLADPKLPVMGIQDTEFLPGPQQQLQQQQP